MLHVVCTLALLLVSVSGAQDKTRSLNRDWCKPDDCYDVLGVKPTSSFRDIKARYKELSRTMHPDKIENPSEADRNKYVRIVNAYEILSSASERHLYDEYLRIKTSMDSPRENILFVGLLIYGVATVLVHCYGQQRYEHTRKLILDQERVQQWFLREKGVDITGQNQTPVKEEKKLTKLERRKLAKENKRGRKRKNAAKNASPQESAAQSDSASEESERPPLSRDASFSEKVQFYGESIKDMMIETDPTKDTTYTSVTDSQINEVIKELNLEVPGWNKRKPKPDWTDASTIVWTTLRSNSMNAYRWLDFQLKYKVMNQEMTAEESVKLCCDANDVSAEEWSALGEKKRKVMLDRKGVWNLFKGDASSAEYPGCSQTDSPAQDSSADKPKSD